MAPFGYLDRHATVDTEVLTIHPARSRRHQESDYIGDLDNGA
jgi:hypothetical protein